jgi:hypothetical protein
VFLIAATGAALSELSPARCTYVASVAFSSEPGDGDRDGGYEHDGPGKADTDRKYESRGLAQTVPLSRLRDRRCNVHLCHAHPNLS